MGKRDIMLDIARSFCVLWIIGVWHMMDYVGHNPAIDMGGAIITRGVLSCFTFLSGFFLGKKQISVESFYKSRLLRFWPLLFLSATSMYIMGLIDNTYAYLGTITGLSCFVMPWAFTLWYFSMLIFFYAITPLLLYKDNHPLKTHRVTNIIIRGVVILILLTLYSQFNTETERLIPYYVFYVLGIITPYSMMGRLKKIYIQVVFTVLSIASIYVDLLFKEEVLHVVASFFIVGMIFIISSWIEAIGNSRMNKTFTLISYSSMCAYLFHRQVYGVIAFVSKRVFGFVPLSLAPIMIIVILVAAYFVQNYYDIIINKLNIKYGSKS